MMLTTFLVALIPAGIMFLLPPPWALAWIVTIWAVFTLIYSQWDFTDDPAFMSFAIIFGFFVPVNGIATIARLAVICEDLAYGSGDGYRDYEPD